MPPERDTPPRTAPDRVRLDKWLWAARFYKTRALASEAIERHRVRLNGADCKPAREVHPGDTLHITQGDTQRTVRVRALSAQRGPAPQAALLYQETDESIAAREAAIERRRFAPEPAHQLTQGRPTKRDRRSLEAMRQAPQVPAWDDRWSAHLPAVTDANRGPRHD